MKIGNKEVKKIVIKDNTGELIANITDDDICLLYTSRCV